MAETRSLSPPVLLLRSFFQRFFFPSLSADFFFCELAPAFLLRLTPLIPKELSMKTSAVLWDYNSVTCLLRIPPLPFFFFLQPPETPLLPADGFLWTYLHSVFFDEYLPPYALLPLFSCLLLPFPSFHVLLFLLSPQSK